MFLSISVTLLLASLVLNFDGSLRVAEDPNMELVKSSISSKFLPPLVASAICLKDETTGKIIALCSRNIPISPFVTSADVEYDALLLGMECIQELTFESNENWKDMHIIVKGDCRMVIDQMNGVSIPRKQKIYYDKISDLVVEIRKKYNISFDFQHVNREFNQVCDEMCKAVILSQQKAEIRKCFDRIEMICNNYEPQEVPTNRKKKIAFVETPFSSVLDDVSSWKKSYIPISLRPLYFCKLYDAFVEVSDVIAIKRLGVIMCEEHDRMKKEHVCLDTRKYIMRTGVMLQCFALIELGLVKEVEKVKKKYRQEIGSDIEKIILDRTFPRSLEKSLHLQNKAEQGWILEETTKLSSDDDNELEVWRNSMLTEKREKHFYKF